VTADVTSIVAIPDALLAAIYAQAIAAFPDECCGYLVGAAADAAEAVVPCRNAQVDARSFDTDCPPRVVYHSHTNGRAYFSTVDRQMAAGPAYPVQHVVVGVTAGSVREAAQFAWSAAAGDFVEVARWRVDGAPP
jgi:proteasome lid subunit RPN8/RPN11